MKDFLAKLPFSLSVGCLILLGLSLILLPSQNNLIAQASARKNNLKQIDFEFNVSSYPLRLSDFDFNTITATGAAVLDRDSGVFLLSKNADLALLPASTIKIMTALVSLDQYSLFEILRVPAVYDAGQDMELKEGELITVEALLYGLLVSSANDAAEVLARNFPGGKEKFIDAMNRKAQSLGLKNSRFVNPTGLDNGEDIELTGEKSYSSAKEMAWLADYALKNQTFSRIVSTKYIKLQDPQGRFFHQLYNLNELLWQIPEVKGVKTGWTEAAGECLVTLVEKNGHNLILVVMGSRNRFEDTKTLINWVDNQVVWGNIN